MLKKNSLPERCFPFPLSFRPWCSFVCVCVWDADFSWHFPVRASNRPLMARGGCDMHIPTNNHLNYINEEEHSQPIANQCEYGAYFLHFALSHYYYSAVISASSGAFIASSPRVWYFRNSKSIASIYIYIYIYICVCVCVRVDASELSVQAWPPSEADHIQWITYLFQ